MESTTTDQQFFDGEPSLSEPHFDEEATVLAARPVVPLATVREVKAVEGKTSFHRPWILGLALVGMLLVGIFATAIYYSRVNKKDSQSFGDAGVAAGVEADTTKSADGFSEPAPAQLVVNPETPAGVKKQPANQTVKSSADPSKKPLPRLVAVITEKGDMDEEIEESREDQKAARKQARQERRRAQRERRDAKSSDDLLRIRDIFEGSPRP